MTILVLSFLLLTAAAAHEEGQACQAHASTNAINHNHENEEESGGGRVLDSSNNGNADSDDYYDCGLYMAESSIPNSGWGMYAGAKGYPGGHAFPLDVAVVMTDLLRDDLDKDRDGMPKFKLKDYVWDRFPTCCDFHVEGKEIKMVLPSLGSLANSHTRLYNVRPWLESVDHRSILRSNASAGAFSQCQGIQFVAKHDIAPGYEIFAEYGDNWFARRYPDVPRKTDFKTVDQLISTWGELVALNRGENYHNDEESYNLLSNDATAQALWHSLASTSKHLNERIQSIMPQTHTEAVAALRDPKGLAGATSTAYRPLEWLQQHGMCIDNLQLKPSDHVPYQNGAFIKRPFSKGERVAPIPVIPILRQQLQIDVAQGQGQQYAQQLLLNYCYGHPESSMLLFPYGPVVNLINHAGGYNKQQANVALRWSQPLNNRAHFQQSVHELLTSSKTVIVLELYALRDLKANEEVLLDYGTPFEMAWQRHQHEWQKLSPPIHAQDYQPPLDFDFVIHRERQEGGEEKIWHDEPPSHMKSRCWIDIDAAKDLGKDEDGWYPFVKLTHARIDMSTSKPCEIELITLDDDKYYVVVYNEHKEEEASIKNVPRSAFTFVDKPYQGHQFLRQAFRHEIYLPDELYPEAWKDLPVVPPTCKLYMAESSSSSTNSTVMGVYTAQPIAAGDRIHFGDVVVPVVDYQQNNRLQRLYHRTPINRKKNRQVSLKANTTEVRSIIPGLGMLANSYYYTDGDGVVTNAKIVVEPRQTMTTLHPAHDPGAGASSYYHDAYSSATKSLQAGEELIFENVVGDTRTAAAPETGLPSNKGRSIEWLETNGRCLDSLRPGDSTILQAGKGAFATRTISQGAVIAPMPVMAVLRDDLNLYEQSVDNDKHGNDLRKQLLINYCYGHPGSSLLLFPYSPIVNYVNHNSTPNAKLQWSTLSSHHLDWLNRAPADVAGGPNAGLIMELVALRDIKPGEEVFINYGDEWAQKWREFENGGWRPVGGEDVSAWRLNKRMEWLRTEDELQTDPYPFKNIWTACAVGRERWLVDGSAEEPPVYKWSYQDGILENTDNFLPCDILERDVRDANLAEVMDRRESISPLNVYYKVRVYEEDDKTTSYFISLPRKAIRFFDKAYLTDLFLPAPFRHEIQLPDEMVSQAWRDI